MKPFKELSEREIKAVSRYIEKLTKREVKAENICSSCHGINGDGEGVGKFNPFPKPQ
ncbi:hypothetical protein LM594_00715 [Candidatus Caldipriscus sp.]|nr:hypothetical protein [Candidatus Caldipriscus sp.]